MHFAIIAAGEGSRLRQEGIQCPKPLVPILGQPMVDRLMGIMQRCHAESISIICNSSMPDVCRHLSAVHCGVPLHVIAQQTPSSMHSLALLSEVIPEGKVIITTVDTIFHESDFAAYVEAFEHHEGALFAVTPFVDDEKPLWVSAAADDGSAYPAVTAFSDVRPETERLWVSGGIYGLDTMTAWPILHRCIASGQSRMRNYQRALLQAGVQVRAFVFDKIMDIDHACDLALAQTWLNGGEPLRILQVARAAAHSPNNVERDAAILHAVGSQLALLGYEVDTVPENELLGWLDQQDLTDGCLPYVGVAHMARTLPVLMRLARFGVPVINAPRSVMSVAHSREFVLSMLHEAGVPVPPWWAYDPEADEMFQCDDELQALLPGWVKATRAGGARPDDVMWVDTPLAADARVIQLAAEQVPDIVVTRHIDGDLLKVYCVADAAGQISFLRTFYPQELGYSKFGEAEEHNSPLARTPYSLDTVTAIAQSIAGALCLQVFGFDAIVQPDGQLVVIDVNDWPSFSVCCPEAADAIARLLACRKL